MSSSHPIIVAGMHRSGTSLVASFLEAGGVDMGDVIDADRHNPSGYFEDRAFLGLNRRILAEGTPAGASGHRDWGWTESGSFQAGRAAGHLAAARALLDARRRTSRPWGWKDPRNALLLDFWDEAIGGARARYLLVYRYPWDVADSMQRLGAAVFLENPLYAYSIWELYNRTILDFHRRHADRSLLVSVNSLLQTPDRLLTSTREKLGVDLGEATVTDRIDTTRGIVELSGVDPLIGWVAGASPSSVGLLSELDEAADISSRGLWQERADTGTPEPSTRAPEPIVSVVIPCLDHGQFLIEAIASVERTVEAACEIIVVNDGSQQPRTLEILELVKRHGHQVIDQENQGISGARNRGIEAARGFYIVPLDCDNRLRDGFVDDAVRVLDRTPRVGVVYGSWQEFGMRSRLRRPPDFDLDRLLTGNYIDACAMFRKATWAEVDGFHRETESWEDWEFWISVAERGWRFHRLETVCFDYRVRPNSLVTTMKGAEAREQVVRRVVDRHRDLFARFRKQRLGVLDGWISWLERDREQARAELAAIQEDNRPGATEGAEADDRPPR